MQGEFGLRGQEERAESDIPLALARMRARAAPHYSGFSSSLLALSCSASLAQVWAISISRALLVLSVASRAKRRHSAARL
jgi:hypothetical protein